MVRTQKEKVFFRTRSLQLQNIIKSTDNLIFDVWKTNVQISGQGAADRVEMILIFR
jgi:hypothetical protein